MSAKKTTSETTNPSADAGKAVPEKFEDALRELESLISDMQSDAVPLDDLLVHYQRGSALLAHCRGKLRSLEQQVQQLEPAGGVTIRGD